MKRTASRVLPEAPLKTRVFLSILSVLLLFMSAFSVYSFLNMSEVYSSIPDWIYFLVYQVLTYTFLFFGAIALVLGKRVGWFVVTSYFILRVLPRIDKLIGLLFFDEEWTGLVEYLYGSSVTVSLTAVIVFALLLAFMYSRGVTSLYKIERIKKLVPIIAVLLLGSLRLVLNNFL